MAKTQAGKKIVHVPEHTRRLPSGKVVKVEEHYRLAHTQLAQV